MDERDSRYRRDHEALLDYGRHLNHLLQARKVTESERAFLICGILLALEDPAFAADLRAAADLPNRLLAAILGAFAGLPPARRDELTQAFAFIPHSPALQDRDFLITLIEGVADNLRAFHRAHPYRDTIGHFYVEFLRYANNDKSLGIVLTPQHIADLLVALAGVDEHSVVFDNCCGTGGLLVAAMHRMRAAAGPDRRVTAQVHGIEFQSKVYALAVANMLLHGDGELHIQRGDCFTAAPAARPTVGLLNPPYRNKQSKRDREELDYILNNLAALRPGGACLAIVPITCATAPDGAIAALKRALLADHTLEAVMSLPLDLFINSRTTVVTCIMVFTAHRPHPPDKQTWFAYWRDDGLIKTKHRGRIDARGTWPELQASWLAAFRERAQIPGTSVLRRVDATDEWVAEAYLDTDYAAIDEPTFLQAMKRHLLTRIVDRP